MFTNYFFNKRNRELIKFLKCKRGFLINYLSVHGELDFQKINKLQSIINWQSRSPEIDFDNGLPIFYSRINGLSDNISVKWSLELIDQFKDKWNWKHLSRNASLNWWSEALINYYEDKWDWIELSDNNNLNLNISQIENFKTKWNWKSSNFHYDLTKSGWNKKITTGICGNKSIHWDFYKIQKFEDLIDWQALSLNPNIEFDWNFEPDNDYCRPLISYNCKLSDGDFYHRSINSLLSIFKNWDFNNLSFNPSIGRNLYFHDPDQVVAFLKNYEFNWEGLSKNPSIPWSSYLIEALMECINWKSFSKLIPEPNYMARDFTWSMDIIEKYKNKLDWQSLSSNPSLPWDINLLAKYEDLWDWEKISLNNGIPWSKKILSKYENLLKWELLSKYSAVPWDRYLTKKFKGKIDWQNIYQNKRVKWSKSMLRTQIPAQDLEFIFKNDLETALKWENYRWFIKDEGEKYLALIDSKYFCEVLIKPLLVGTNFDNVLNEHLDNFFYRTIDPISGNEKYIPNKH